MIVDARRLLADRIAGSKYLNRSAHLRDLLLYLTQRVIEDENGKFVNRKWATCFRTPVPNFEALVKIKGRGAQLAMPLW